MRYIFKKRPIERDNRTLLFNIYISYFNKKRIKGIYYDTKQYKLFALTP